MLVCKRNGKDLQSGKNVDYEVNVDFENPIVIFDSVFNETVKYCELPVDFQNIIDRYQDEMEEGMWCNLKQIGYGTYECFQAERFELMRKIEGVLND